MTDFIKNFWEKIFFFFLGVYPSKHDLGSVLNKRGRGSLELGMSISKIIQTCHLWSTKNKQNTPNYNFVYEFRLAPYYITREKKKILRMQSYPLVF